MLTPNDIDVLIHCRTTPEPHPYLHTPAGQESHRKLERNGVIYFDTKAGWFRTTAKGDAHVRQICALPFPTTAFIDAAGNVIK